MAAGADAFEGIESAVEVALHHPFEADDFDYVRRAWEAERVESGALEFALDAQARGSFVDAHREKEVIGGRRGVVRVAPPVFIGPRSAAFVAHDAADSPA